MPKRPNPKPRTKNLVKKLTDEFLLDQLLTKPEVEGHERAAVRVMLAEVRRIRPMTRTRGKLSTKQRAAVEERFKILGLEEGLDDRIKRSEDATTPKRVVVEIPEQYKHPLAPPNRTHIPMPQEGLSYIDRETGVFHEILRVNGAGFVREDGVTVPRSEWTYDRAQVLK